MGVHLGFIRAGADLIETNTFGANRRKLSALLLDDNLAEIVQSGVKLAREARDVSGRPVLIAGAIGPLGDLEDSGAENTHEVFLRAEARLLDGRGVDLFMVETFFELGELETAIKAVRESPRCRSSRSSRDEDAQTLAGVAARDAFERLRALDVVAIGANCGVGPVAALAALSEMSAQGDGFALTAQPNVGLPSRSGGASSIPTRRRTISASSPRRRATSGRGSSAVAAERRPRRSRPSTRRSSRSASRGCRCSSSSARSWRPSGR